MGNSEKSGFALSLGFGERMGRKGVMFKAQELLLYPPTHCYEYYEYL